MRLIIGGDAKRRNEFTNLDFKFGDAGFELSDIHGGSPGAGASAKRKRKPAARPTSGPGRS
jgi:hypothetical protein